MGGDYLPHGRMKSLKTGTLIDNDAFLLDLHLTLTTDVAEFIQVNLDRDIQTINHRTQHEGFAFLSVTLPAFGKACLASYEAGSFQIQKVTGFHRRPGRALPEFLQGLLERIFDIHTGLIKHDACYVAVWAIQQITQFLYKYERPYTAQVEQKKLLGMLDTDQSLPRSYPMEQFPQNENRGKILYVASLLADDLLKDLDLVNITPRHGPGAVSESGLLPYDKYNFRTFDALLDSHYPQSSYCVASPSEVNHGGGYMQPLRYPRVPPSKTGSKRRTHKDGRRKLEAVVKMRHRLPSIDIDTSKTCTVPKDSRGPRIIEEQSKERLYLQLGQKAKLYAHLENHKWTRGHINFTDQSVNAGLALKNSATREFATLDMKDASDRVSLALVHALFPESVFRLLYATRCKYTLVQLPGQPARKFKLRKFAGMGSGVCFPVESLVFWLLGVAALMVSCDLPFRKARSSIYVYGDDLLVPSRYAKSVMCELETFGLKFNLDKCFIDGPFRESCGTDAFTGVEVTPVRLKKQVPGSKSDAESLVSWTMIANNFCMRGLYGVSSKMFKVVEDILGPLPLGSKTASYLCRWGEIRRDLLPRMKPRTKLIARGKGFSMYESIMRVPDYHAKRLNAWVVRTGHIRPNSQVFSESARYLHAVLTGTEDSTVFTLRNHVKLTKVPVIIS